MKKILAIALLFLALATPLYPQDAAPAPIPSITFEGSLTGKSEADLLKTVNAVFNFVSNEDNFCIQNIKQKNCLSNFDGGPAYVLVGVGEGQKLVSFKINFEKDGKIYGEANTENQSPVDHQNIVKILMKLKVYFVPNMKIKAENWPGFKEFQFNLKAHAITPPAPITAFQGQSKLSQAEVDETISAYRATRDEAGLRVIDGAKKIAESRDLKIEATEVFSQQTNFRGFILWVTPEKPVTFKFNITTLDPPTLAVTINETFSENELAGARVLRDFVNTMLRANKELQIGQLINIANVTDRDERVIPIGAPDAAKTPGITFTPGPPSGTPSPVEVKTPEGATAVTPGAAPSATEIPAPTPSAGTEVNAMSSTTIFILAGVVIVIIIIVIVMARKGK